MQLVDSWLLIFFVVVFCYREWYHSKHAEVIEIRLAKERQMLLDRLMAQDFAQFKQAEMLQTQVQYPADYQMPDTEYANIGM